MGIDRPLRRAVFVDRDGILNVARVVQGKPHPPSSPEDLRLIEGVREVLTELHRLGWLIIGVTNQPDVARGVTTRAAVDEINSRVSIAMGLDDMLVCFHDDRDDCACRKPRPGLLLEAAARYGIDLTGSFMIGDRWKDISCGKVAGCRTVFVDYGYAEAYRGPPPTRVAASAAEAMKFVLSMEEGSE